MTTPNILIINIHSHHNVGDAALTDMTLKTIRKHFPDSKITLAFNDKSSYRGNEKTVDSFLSWIKTSNSRMVYRFVFAIFIWILTILSYRIFRTPFLFFVPKYLRPLVQAYCQSDIIISSPGGYLYSFSKGGDFIIIILSTLLAIFLNKPLFLFPQSFGPLSFWREKVLLKWLINKADLVMIREINSLNYLKSIKVRQKNMYLLPDLGFAYAGKISTQRADYLINQNNPLEASPLLGITVMNWGKQNKRFDIQTQYETALKDAIKFFIDTYDGKVIFFPQCSGPSEGEDDRILASKIAKELQEYKNNITVVSEMLTPEASKTIYGQMDIFLGTRMHSNIFALSEGVPSLIISYLHKSDGIAKSIGMEDWVINISEITSELIITKITQLWEKREKIREELNIRIPQVLDSVTETGVIFENYARNHLPKNNYE